MTHYALHDYYNVTAITDAFGAVVERYGYSGFGDVRYMTESFGDQTASNYKWDLLYKSQFRDEETGYDNYGFRYYVPMLGRWINRDPLEEESGFNLYAFVGNNGINGTDLLGLDYHHWLPQKGGAGQANVDRKCGGCCKVNIDDFTTPMDGVDPTGGMYRDTPHGFVTHVMKYNKVFDTLMTTSPNCCTFMMGVDILMNTVHSALQAQQSTSGFGRGTSYNNGPLDLQQYKGGGVLPNKNLEWTLKVAECCKMEAAGAASVLILRTIIEDAMKSISDSIRNRRPNPVPLPAFVPEVAPTFWELYQEGGPERGQWIKDKIEQMEDLLPSFNSDPGFIPLPGGGFAPAAPRSPRVIIIPI